MHQQVTGTSNDGVGEKRHLASRHSGLVVELSPSGQGHGSLLGKPPLTDLCDLAVTLWWKFTETPGFQVLVSRAFRGLLYRSSLVRRQGFPIPFGWSQRSKETRVARLLTDSGTAEAWEAWTHGPFTSESPQLVKAHGPHWKGLEADDLSEGG